MSTSAREKLRQEQARQASRARRNKMIGLVAGLLALVLLAVVLFAVIGHRKRSADAQQSAGGDTLATALTSIPKSTFDAVGTGLATNGPQAIPGATVSGKPRVLYIGGDFCPYCAMERMSLTAALSRFGTFSGLQDALSSPNEGALSNIPTLSYDKVAFTSDTVDFTAVETADRMGNPTNTPSPADQKIFQQYAPKGGIPFTYYGTAFANWAPFDGSDMAGRSSADLAKALSDPNSQETKKVVGAANVISAQICRETADKPADVCTSPGVVAAAKTLK